MGYLFTAVIGLKRAKWPIARHGVELLDRERNRGIQDAVEMWNELDLQNGRKVTPCGRM